MFPFCQIEDSLWASLEDQHTKMPMGITAENLAAQQGVTREECDEYAMQSQQRWYAAHQAGRSVVRVCVLCMLGV